MPSIRAARTVENGLYLVVLILWVTHFLALYRALRGTRLAPALFGSVLGIVGLGALAAGALPHVATSPISDLYHAPGVTPEDQATLVLLWQATEGIFDGLLFSGLAIVAVGLTALGVAMLGTPAFGKGVGWLSVVIGVAGVAAGVDLLIDPGSPIAAVSVLSLIVFHLVLGWRVSRLSRDSVGTLDDRGNAYPSPARRESASASSKTSPVCSPSSPILWRTRAWTGRYRTLSVSQRLVET